LVIAAHDSKRELVSWLVWRLSKVSWLMAPDTEGSVPAIRPSVSAASARAVTVDGSVPRRPLFCDTICVLWGPLHPIPCHVETDAVVFLVDAGSVQLGPLVAQNRPLSACRLDAVSHDHAVLKSSTAPILKPQAA